ncbi:hypothetical protein [Mucilaginibacter jinjuensis]|uniref:Uncharacterized protein n=1 Tax=Mucilaginibacter jinjuensis TaxID=1176721 RepID=A0ABY7T419_9SPHI|nr:hypothetical protein [Mucilaginibacter jinjuensis]WCT11013.1 hypothetical protein PQO05_19945 [Mucilaginibacter jinjuensis]
MFAILYFLRDSEINVNKIWKNQKFSYICSKYPSTRALLSGINKKVSNGAVDIAAQ